MESNAQMPDEPDLGRGLAERWRNDRRLFARLGRSPLVELRRLATSTCKQIEQSGLRDVHSLLSECKAARAALTRAVHLGAADTISRLARPLFLIGLTCHRYLGILPSETQLFAALAMYEGYAVDMPPGEGKTLAVACCAVLHAWSGRPTHVICANEHLVMRAAQEMGKLYAMTACSIAWLAPDMPRGDCRRAYHCDVVYATGRQVLADHMRELSLLGGSSDPLRRQICSLRQPRPDQAPLMRGLICAVVDEIDRVLIDDALSPLVVSAGGDYSVLEEATQAARLLIDELQPGRDYRIVYLPFADVVFTQEGRALLKVLSERLPIFWRHPRRAEDVLVHAILARDVLQPEVHYLVQDRKIAVTGESLQSLLGGRSWYFGVLQAVEAREGLALTAPPRTVARTAFQNFFPQYRYLSGAGSLFADVARELKEVYDLRIALAPSAAAAGFAVRSRFYACRDEKIGALCDRAQLLYRQQLPVLIICNFAADMDLIAKTLGSANVQVHGVPGRGPEEDLGRITKAGLPGAVTLMSADSARESTIAINKETATADGLHLLLCGHQELKRTDLLLSALAGSREGRRCAEVYVAPDDSMLVRGLPFWGKPLLLVRFAPFRNPVLALLVRLSQANSGRRLTRHRMMLLKREEQLDQQLAFSRKV